VEDGYQNVRVCSSAISMTGGPPLEILVACARVSFPPTDAAHASSAGSERKWTSAIRSEAGLPWGDPLDRGGDELGLAGAFLDGHRYVLVPVRALERRHVLRG
jgi:hypothetical protein